MHGDRRLRLGVARGRDEQRGANADDTAKKQHVANSNASNSQPRIGRRERYHAGK